MYDSEQYISLAEASELSPYSQAYLSLRARQGKLQAKKIGRNWVTTHEWLEAYVKDVELYKNGNFAPEPPDNLPVSPSVILNDTPRHSEPSEESHQRNRFFTNVQDDPPSRPRLSPLYKGVAMGVMGIVCSLFIAGIALGSPHVSSAVATARNMIQDAVPPNFLGASLSANARENVASLIDSLLSLERLFIGIQHPEPTPAP